MNPLSIAVNDYLSIALNGSANVAPVKITAVTPSTVNGQKSYDVVAGGIHYTCTAANTTILETTKNSGGVATWVLGA